LRERVRGWLRRPPRSTTPRTVLIAEADAAARRSLAGMVQRLGYVALEAGSAADALRLLESIDPDLVLLALEVDQGGGLEALDQVREVAPEVPVVMLAADWRDGRTAEAMRRGAVAYLARPFGADDLREVLARH
jgi:two-component system response regulator RegA